MRKFKKHIRIGLALCLGISLMGAGRIWSIWNGKKVVGASQMQMYSDAYLRKYNQLVERAALPKYRKEFADYARAPFMIDAVISIDHGAAVQFIPAEEPTFQSRTVQDGIDQEVFPQRSPNISGLMADQNDLVDRGYPKIDRVFRVSAHDIVLTRLSVRGILVLETGSLMTKEMVVQGIYYPNTIIVKGCSERKYWSSKVAQDDASRSFHLDLIAAYFLSQEFREFVATPELTQMAKDMVDKKNRGLYGDEYGYIRFRDDLHMLIAKAETYGISPEFAKSLYEFLEKKKSWFEKHVVLTGILSAVLFAILLWVLKLGYKRLIAGKN